MNKRIRLQKTEILFEWAKSQGARFDNIEIINDDDTKDINRTAQTLSRIDKGGEICFIPKEILLSESVAIESNIGQKVYKHLTENAFDAIDSQKYPHCVEVICMASFMVYEHYKGNSFWEPYLDILPLSFNMPTCWTKEEIDQLLEGTFLKHMTIERLKWLHTVVDILLDLDFGNTLTFERFLWAYCSITSRAFPKTVKKQDVKEVSSNQDDWVTITEICLYPVLDMFNHDKDCKIVWLMSSDGVSFIAQSAIDAGAEVFNNYGPKGNENLLANYGFVIENNTEDYVKICLNIKEEDPLAPNRRKLVSKLHLEKFHMLFIDDEELTIKLRTITNVMTANEYELEKLQDFLSKKMDWTLEEVLEKQITNRNKLVGFQTLYSLVRDKLSLATKGKKKMKHMQCNTDPAIYRLASIYRLGQISIMKNSLDLIKKHVEELLSALFYVGHPDMPSEFMDLLNSMELDEDSVLSFLLIHELHNTKSKWYETLQSSTLSVETYQETLGDMFEDFSAYYEEEVKIYVEELSKLPNFDAGLYTFESFCWAASLLQTKSATIAPNTLIDGLEHEVTCISLE